MESTLPRSTTTPSTTSERAPMKQSSSMITGPAWIGSSTPPMPTPPERWTFLPIWAQEPTVTQVSTMVPLSTRAPTLTKLGITTTPGRDIGRAAHDRARHDAKTRLAEAVGAPALELQRHLVIGLGADIHGHRILQAEGEQHRLLQPLPRDPGAVLGLGDPELAGIEPRQRRLDRVGDFPLGRGIDRLALFPGGVDRLRELAVVHSVVPLANGRFAQGFAPAAHAR